MENATHGKTCPNGLSQNDNFVMFKQNTCSLCAFFVLCLLLNYKQVEIWLIVLYFNLRFCLTFWLMLTKLVPIKWSLARLPPPPSNPKHISVHITSLLGIEWTRLKGEPWGIHVIGRPPGQRQSPRDRRSRRGNLQAAVQWCHPHSNKAIFFPTDKTGWIKTLESLLPGPGLKWV